MVAKRGETAPQVGQCVPPVESIGERILRSELSRFAPEPAIGFPSCTYS
jgi:hypothetical protein